jgi:hypothetical protein
MARVIGFARHKRGRGKGKVHPIHAPKKKRLILILDPEGNDAYFKPRGTYTLQVNPKKLSSAELRELEKEGELVAFNVRKYDPIAFEKEGLGVMHEARFKTKEEVERYVRSELVGRVDPQIESSMENRFYIQGEYRMPDGSIVRRHIPLREIMKVE